MNLWNEINVIATALSGVFAGLSFYASNISKKAKNEAQKKLDAAVLQAESARRSAQASEEANQIAREHIDVLESQLKRQSESNPVSLTYFDEDSKPGYLWIRNTGSGVAHRFQISVTLNSETVTGECDVLGSGDSLELFFPEEERSEIEFQRRERSRTRNKMRMPNGVIPAPSYEPRIASKVSWHAHWVSPLGNPQSDTRS